MSIISVRLPEDMLSELDRIAEETERDRTFHIRKAIESYLMDYDDLVTAEKRYLDPSDEIITGEELRRRLGL